MEDAIAGVSSTPGEAQETTGLDEKKVAVETTTESSTVDTKPTGESEAKVEKFSDATVDDFLGESEEEKKSGYQKRVDQLIGENKSLKERLDRIESSKPDGEKEYTPQELRAVTKKALEEGDANLLSDVMDYKVEQVKKELTKNYTEEQKRINEDNQARMKEWTEVVNDYAHLTNPDGELYEGSSKELNIKDPNSILFKIAVNLFNTQEKYRQYGGQRVAVADALSMILKKRKTTGSTNATKSLERQLAKEKQKSSLAGGDSLKAEEAPGKALSDKERLNEVISERRKFRRERE